jgi:hypothetical protein
VLEDFSPFSSPILFYFIFGTNEKNSFRKKNTKTPQNSSSTFFKTSLGDK